MFPKTIEPKNDSEMVIQRMKIYGKKQKKILGGFIDG